MFRRSWNIDAKRYGNVARFFNHSCRPNVGSSFVHVGNEPFLRVAFFSACDIYSGDELTIVSINHLSARLNVAFRTMEMSGGVLSAPSSNANVAIKMCASGEIDFLLFLMLLTLINYLFETLYLTLVKYLNATRYYGNKS